MNDLTDRMIEEKNAEYFIVSNDGDFDNYIQEKQKRKINISKIPEVCKANQNPAQSKPAANNGSSKEIDAYKKKEMAFRSHFGKYLKDEYD